MVEPRAIIAYRGGHVKDLAGFRGGESDPEENLLWVSLSSYLHNHTRGFRSRNIIKAKSTCRYSTSTSMMITAQSLWY